MNLVLVAASFAAGLFLLMLAAIEVGRRVGVARLARDPEGLAQGISATEGAIFALLGLILAFTFSGAASRFEERRHLVTEEANAIGTAYLRIDLVPAEAQPELRDLFRRYLDVRVKTYANVEDLAAANAWLAEAGRLQAVIWNKALTASQRPGAAGSAPILLLPALNAMFDITATRVTATRNHPPPIVFLLLAGLSLAGSLLVGYDMAGNKERDWFHTVIFAVIMSLAVYVILDMEFPRLGLIRIDAADQALIDVGKSMK